MQAKWEGMFGEKEPVISEEETEERSAAKRDSVKSKMALQATGADKTKEEVKIKKLRKKAVVKKVSHKTKKVIKKSPNRKKIVEKKVKTNKPKANMNKKKLSYHSKQSVSVLPYYYNQNNND